MMSIFRPSVVSPDPAAEAAAAEGAEYAAMTRCLVAAGYVVTGSDKLGSLDLETAHRQNVEAREAWAAGGGDYWYAGRHSDPTAGGRAGPLGYAADETAKALRDVADRVRTEDPAAYAEYQRQRWAA